jgi:hypothetical protein
MIPLAAEGPAWISLAVALIALGASAFATWHTARREGTRAQYADETARNAQFQMAKREVYAALLSAGQAYRQHPTDAERRNEFEREYARARMYAGDALSEALRDRLEPGSPFADPDWEQLAEALRADI